MAIPRVRMFAGPNGSGKSELIHRLQHFDLPLGPVVNADRILSQLVRSRFIDLKDFELSGITQNDWTSALNEIDELSSRVDKAGEVPSVEIDEDMLVCDGELNAYSAALIADFIRYMMLEQKLSFSFETVIPDISPRNFFISKAKFKWRRNRIYIR